MKKIILTIAACAALVACKKDDNGQLDPNAMIALNYAATAPTSAATTYSYNPDGSAKYLSAKEIVEKTSSLCFINEKLGQGVLARNFSETQRDFVNNRLLMFGTDIISQFGELKPGFIEGRDFILIIRGINNNQQPIDTVGYIPNAVMRKAEGEIKAAYTANNFTKCYELFDKAFTFTPITGNEWLKLKAKGVN